MTIKSIRILVRLEFPSGTVRLWDGSGPYVDGDGEVWGGAGALPNLDGVESALNMESSVAELAIAGTEPEVADIAWAESEDGDVIGAKVQILIQPCDEYDQPVGPPEVRSTTTIDNIRFDETVSGDSILSTVIAECTNRATLRNVISGSVLSDVDQRARSVIINPSAPADRFCERIPMLADQTIDWPNGW